MTRSSRRRRLFAVACAGLVVVLAAGPSLARAVRAELAHMLASGISGSVTYRIVDEGKTVGQVTKGVVGTGTIAGKLSLQAQLAAALLGSVKGVPVASVARGGSYATQYDIDARGDHVGLVVIRFAAHGVGSLCVRYTAVYGKFDPRKGDYVPSTTSFATVGGDGAIATVHASGTVTQGEVTGSAIEQILAHGAVGTLTKGAATPLSAACTAVEKRIAG